MSISNAELKKLNLGPASLASLRIEFQSVGGYTRMRPPQLILNRPVATSADDPADSIAVELESTRERVDQILAFRDDLDAVPLGVLTLSRTWVDVVDEDDRGANVDQKIVSYAGRLEYRSEQGPPIDVSISNPA